VAVRDGTKKWLYIDGQREANSDICDNIEWAGHNVYIGARANNNQNTNIGAYNKGGIDEVRVYDVPLTYAEVLYLQQLKQPPQNLLADTWKASGEAKATLDYYDVHWGNKAMKVVVGDSSEQEFQPVSIVSCVQLPFEPEADWTEGGPKAVSIWYKGDPNVKEVKVNADTDGNQLVPDIDIKSTDWQEMHFVLADFGVPLDEIDSLTMEIEQEAGTKATVYVDDIRLYPARCVPKYGPISDMTGDCLVDGGDLRLLVADWLDHDYTIVAQAPDPCGLLAWYEFDGDANDSSGNGNHGTLYGNADASTGVLTLDGDMDYVVVGGVGIDGNMPRTITGWVKADTLTIPDWTNIFGFTSTPDGGCDLSFDMNRRGGQNQYCMHVYCWESNIMEIDLEWHHLAGTYDGTTIKWYGDGRLVGSQDRVLVTQDNYQMGKRGHTDNCFPGQLDDLRVYNYALSHAEIISTMGLAELYFPLDSAANLYDAEPQNSKWVNFKDYAIMADEWLLELLYGAP
jgi:hypothetical protein